ncbi:MAG: hypothetical protein NE328_07825 [Lentisphaeraceae bacterium]|nr:hypothetical protein [Lentisphaeraceae bacterium]
MESIIAKELLETISENINLMFLKSSMPQDDISVALRPDFENEYICMISLANQKFQGQLVVGLPDSVVKDMLSDVMQLVSNPVESAQLLKAALGELLNTVAGTYAQKAPLLENYECLDLSTPSVYEISEVPFFCKSDGLTGTVKYHTGELINVYISINPYLTMDKGDDSEEFDIENFLDGDDLDSLLSGL